MNISLVPIKSDIAPFLLEVYASTRAEDLKFVPWSDEVKKAFVKSQFENQSRYYLETYPNGFFDAVKFNDELVGRIYKAELDDEIRILDATLLPEFRNQGIGTKLIADVLKFADEKNKPIRIYLETYNIYRSLFSRLGFRLISDDGVYGLWEKKAGEDDRIVNEKAVSQSQ